MMWLVMALWPQPAHSVVAEPLYTSRSRPKRLEPETVVRGAVATAPPWPLPFPSTGWLVPEVEPAEAWLTARFWPSFGGTSSGPICAESTRGVLLGSCGVLISGISLLNRQGVEEPARPLELVFAGLALGYQNRPHDGRGRNRRAVVMADRHQVVVLRLQVQPQQVAHLAVAVLIDHVDPVVRPDELDDLVLERHGANAQVVGLEPASRHLDARLFDGHVAAAVGDDAHAAARLVQDGLGDVLLGGVVVLFRSVHHARPDLGQLAVAGILVVARAAREVAGRLVLRSGDGPPGDAVVVNVAVATPLAVQAVQVLRRQHLATVELSLGVLERVGHPQVHAEVEIAQQEDRRLQPLRQVEGELAELVHLFDRARQEDWVLRIAVREAVGEGQVTLVGARRQAGRGAHALDVADDRRNLGEVTQACELSHERDAGARGRRHGAGTGPAGADDHAGGRQLVL